jgi:hypothetical protein
MAQLSGPETTGGTLRSADAVVSRAVDLNKIQIQKSVVGATRLQRHETSLEVEMGKPVGKK